MKKGKIYSTVCAGLLTASLFFTGCNNELVASRTGGNKVKVKEPVTSEQDVIDVFKSAAKEYANFSAKTSTTSRSVAKSGEAAGTQIANVQKEVLTYIKDNWPEIAKLLAGFYNNNYLPSKDLALNPDIDMANITPSKLLEATYYYMKSVDEKNLYVPATYDDFITKYKLSDTRDFLKYWDKYVEISKLKIKGGINYTADSKKLSSDAVAAAGLRFQDFSDFIVAVHEYAGESVPENAELPLKYLSATAKGSGNLGYTYGVDKSITGINLGGILDFIDSIINSVLNFDFDKLGTLLVDYLTVNADADIRFNIVTSEGKGGYFKICPAVNGSVKASENDITLSVSVSDGLKTTFEEEYSLKEFVKAYGSCVDELIMAVVDCIPSTDELDNLFKAIAGMIPGVGYPVL